ncbi:MAG: branched-chain amino acid ABC transporter substrate-binding protein, partial [Burkholderiaceae bacterium]|nr:branched-chain amino acid ABC transporter substrate-binding protein [Burkholderiaceae bacterium]
MDKRQLLKTALATGVIASPLARAQAPADKPIRLGMTVSSSGTFALAAQSGQRGVEIWIDDVNTRGGID